MARTATGVNLGTTAVRAVRLAVRDGQLELIAAACKALHPANGGKPAAAPAGNAEPASPEVLPATPPPDQQEPAAAGPDGQTPPRLSPVGQPAPATRTSGRLEAEPDPERERELRADLTSLLRRGGIRSGKMVLGLGAAHALIRYMQVPPVPPWKLDMMMKYEVQEQSSSSESSAFDYRLLDLPDVGGQVTVMLSQVQEKKLLSRLELARRAGMGRPDVDLNCLGLFNSYVYGHGAEADRTVMVVDIGAENLDMVVVRGPALYFARSVSGGGSRFTAAVAEMLRMTFAEAEDLKCTKGAILAPDAAADEARPYAERRLSAALESEIGTLAGVIDSSLMYCRAQTKQAKLRPDEILLSGGGSMLPGLSEALARRLRVRVSRLEPFRRISLGALSGQELEEVSSQAARYAIAVGLAASRLLDGAISFSMVPESVKSRRRFLEGGIYVWYAAGVIWLAAALLIWTALRNKDVLVEAQSHREELLQKAVEAKQKFDRTFDSVDQRSHEVEALEERVYSGRDIVRVMSHLKKHTGGIYRDITILEASNMPPAALSAGAAAGPAASFQKLRRVFVRGVATVRFDRSGGLAAEEAAVRQAQKLIDSYLVELQKQDAENHIVATVTAPLFPSDKSISKEGGQVKAPFVLEMTLSPVEVAAAQPSEKKRP